MQIDIISIINVKGSLSVVAIVVECDIVVNEFKHQLRYYVHFFVNALRNDMNQFISLSWVK